MYMVSITTLTGSRDGVCFEPLPESKFSDKTPRITKTKTLDGGVHIDHRGYIYNDLEFRIKANISTTQETLLSDIFENETFINISCIAGFFVGAISVLDIQNGKMDMAFLVKE